MKLTPLLIAPLMLFSLAACSAESINSDVAVAQASSKADSTQPQTNTTEETRKPNAEWQEPAFESQTRAPIPADTERWRLETVAEGLDHPWAVELLPDGAMLVTERPGSLRVVTVDGVISEPIGGVPEVHAKSQGGLLDVALAPDFESSRRIYLTFAEPTETASRTAAATGLLSADRTELTEVEVIFRQQPEFNSRGHYGSRLVFDRKGHVYVTMGDRMDRSRELAQDPSNTIGTVARVNLDGSIPNDNPFVDDAAKADAIWSWGHRNIQAADLHPETSLLWTIEHGPAGGDELNQPEAGKNYGWPAVTYGENYSGSKVTEGITQLEGTEQPVYYWDPVIAPSGMHFYTGDAFPAWQGDLFIGGLASAQLVRLVLNDDRVVAEEWLAIGERVRDVREGADGFLYLVTDMDNGKVMRIVPES